VSAEVDLARAWKDRWEAAGLDAQVPGKLTADEASQGQALPGDEARPLPYAVLKVEPLRKRFAQRHWSEWHRVTVELYGTGKVAVGVLVSLINATFACPEKLSFAGINANRVHAHTETDDDDEEPTGEKRRGQHVRQAKISFRVHTVTTGY
jgi:hypothetical protein